jgi:hypothetical protein
MSPDSSVSKMADYGLDNMYIIRRKEFSLLHNVYSGSWGLKEIQSHQIVLFSESKAAGTSSWPLTFI